MWSIWLTGKASLSEMETWMLSDFVEAGIALSLSAQIDDRAQEWYKRHAPKG